MKHYRDISLSTDWTGEKEDETDEYLLDEEVEVSGETAEEEVEETEEIVDVSE